VAAVIVVDLPDTADAPHLDCRILPLGDGEIAVDRTLVQAPAGMPARFFVFLREDTAVSPARSKRRKKAEPSGEFQAAPKVELQRCPTLEEALFRARLPLRVRWIPDDARKREGPSWIALQQSLWAHALNLLTVAPGVLVGLDRHTAFYEAELGATCVGAETEVLAGPLEGLRCCALLDALRARGRGGPVVVTLRGDEISRARGGARSLVMPLVREEEGR
jgi:hypothetical protein